MGFHGQKLEGLAKHQTESKFPHIYVPEKHREMQGSCLEHIWQAREMSPSFLLLKTDLRNTL